MFNHNNDNAPIHVLMMPDYRADNPYQSLLVGALSGEDIVVHFPQGYRRGLPIFRQLQSMSPSVQILHLHWLNPYLKGNNLFVNLVYSLKFLLDIYLVKRQGIKVIWTIHNLVSHNALFPRLERGIKQIFLNQLVDQAIVHSQAAQAEVMGLYGVQSQKLQVIPHGHYRDVYPAAIAQTEARQKLNLPEQGLIFLNFGMLRPYKGIEKILEVWRSQPELNTNHYLLIVGKALDVPYASTLRQQVQTINNVALIDQFIPDEAIHLYFSAADIIVLPFNQILTSGSLLLAVSYGKPIIAPNLPNLRETLGEATDFLYDPDDPTGLLMAMQRSLNSDLTLLQQKVEQAGDRLSWDRIAQATKKTYLS